MKKLFYSILFLLCYSSSLFCCSLILKTIQPQFLCLETKEPSKKEYQEKEAFLQEKITQLELDLETINNKKTNLLDTIKICLQKKKYYRRITLIIQQLGALQERESQYTGCSFYTNNKHELVAHINKEHPNTQRFDCPSCGDGQLYSLHPGYCPVIRRNEPVATTCRSIEQSA